LTGVSKAKFSITTWAITPVVTSAPRTAVRRWKSSSPPRSSPAPLKI
jgi:hypothetical protein